MFVDADIAWTAEDEPNLGWARDTNERVPVVRTELTTFILEVFYAVPFQRPDKNGFVGANLVPGW